MQQQSNSPHVPVLDGLRGVAILLVIAFHYLPFFEAGWVGVDLFFVLSGFLITSRLTETIGRKNWLASFYFRRLLRIVPLYGLVLILAFWVLPLAGSRFVTPSFASLLALQSSYWTFTINFYNAFHGWTDNITLVHFWSLACEMQFYLVWPFVVWLLHKRPSTMIAVLMLLTVLALVWRVAAGSIWRMSEIYRYVLLPSRLDAFAMGASLWMVYRAGGLRGAGRRAWTTGALSLTAIVVLGTVIGGWHYADAMVSRYGYTLDAICWASVMAACLGNAAGMGTKLFSQPLLTAAGRYSYGMYVFHLPVWVIMGRLTDAKNGGLGAIAVQGVAALFVTILCAMVSYHLLERRFLRLKTFI